MIDRIFLSVVALTLVNCSTALGQTRQPNIVLLIADDLGYGETGCQGNAEIPTPHIDSIAAGGVRFTGGYVTAAFCSASRAGLLTGRYQTRFGYEFNPIGARNEDPDIGLPASEVTLAEHLQNAGYATALIGKWHLGGTANFHPQRRGFDEFFGFLHEGHYFVPPPYEGVTTWLRRRVLPGGSKGRWTSRDGRLILSTHMNHSEPDYDANNPILRGSQPVDERSFLTDAITREATSFIHRTAERPFFLTVAYNAVHSPMQATEAYMEKFAGIQDVQRRIFAAMLSNMDDSVGQILAALRENQLTDNTLVIFISDNGGPTRELTSSNLPLKGGKGSLYEGGIRVPYLMSYPSRIPSSLVYHNPVISLDIFPTVCAAAGIPLPLNTPLDGVNLLPFLDEGNSGLPHKTLFWRVGSNTALRHGDWKIVRMSRQKADGEWELYNLVSDQAEATDLAPSQPKLLQQLLLEWRALDNQMVAPRFSP